MNRLCARVREILEPFGEKTNTAKRALRVLAVPLAACALLFGATSASADQTVLFSNHTVKTVNPVGTTVNLFDYWVVNGDNDNSANVNNDNKNDNTGINKGRQLKFNGGAGTGINKWTGRSDTNGFGRLSFVKDVLVDGYPAIKEGTYASRGEGVNYTDESLAYLFNNDSQANGKQDGKAVYSNVKGLFQLKDGYYVYDSYGSNGSNGNYAVYNSTTNSFDVYDKAGVYKGDASKETNLGQFFPFDSASKVFDENGNNLSPKKIVDGSTDLNHHFGMSMTTEFVQPTGGKTTKNEDMIFEFSGDDDVWVYIDGVLVGDLGGIHEKATLKINFATGAVHVGHVDNANDDEKTIQNTTIREMFKAAGADTKNFRGNTFCDSSKHTLSFFYLERGAGASNMSLKFNLTTLPSSEVEKVNQNGEAVNGATFALYRSDGPNADWNEGELIAQGTTKDGGQLILQKADDSVLSFDEEHNTNKCDYFVLKEVGLPAGYRSSLTSSTSAKSGELHLQYKEAASGTGGVVVAPETTVTTADGSPWTGSRMWLNGGYLAAKETISLSKETTDNKNNPISSGTTFAVVLKRTGTSEDHTSEDAWTAVTGNPLDGYKLCSAHGIAGAVEAAESADTSVFAVNTKGDYEVTVRSLPGDIEKYAAMMTNKSEAEYTVAVYHTTASSLAGATTENTSMVQYQSINRQFSTVIHLTNVQNRLFVQKVDDLGEPVNGATFQLYKADDVTGNSPSTYAIRPGATPYDTVQANGMTYPYEIKGAACFPLNSAKHAPLIKGTYYLRESMSPDGYEINSTITKVIVDNSGVYVDAGIESDGVRSMSGPGSLIASLTQFGSPDSIDNTLTHIKGKLQGATGADAKGNLTWDQTSAAKGVTPTLADGLMHMRYDKTTQGTKTVLRYVEDKGDRDGRLAIIYADTGINRMALYQDDDANGTDLSTLQLNHLFTTATAVQYTDRRVARLQVTKTVTADDGLTAPTKDAKGEDLTFTFKFTLPESQKGYEAHVFDASGTTAGKSFTLKNGYTHSIKAGETIRVYDLKKGDSYSVSELTTKGEASNGNVLASIVNTVTGSADESVLPAGFRLVSRTAGGEEQSGTGNTITGTIGALVDGKIPASNTLGFTNKYSASRVTLEAKDGLSAKKVLEGRNWADGDIFTVQLTAEDGVPMPRGAKSKVSTVELTNKAQTATFGAITYAKPGTYIYTISEVIPGSDARADGISYSAAVYTATVEVEDNQAGALVVKSVTMKQVRDDAGTEKNVEVADKIATFTNRYDTHEAKIIIHALKILTDNAGTFPLAQNAFSFTLEGMGGYADDNAAFDPKTVAPSIKAPMPQGAEGNIATVGNNADGTVTWPAISYTATADAGRAYVYRFTENLGSVAGMTYNYDGSVYYAVVRNAKKGAGIQTSIEYYKAAENNSVEQLGKNITPSFTNIYSVDPTSVTLQGQKTVSGRDWNQGESYAFNLTAAADDANATGLSKTTAQAVKDGVVAVNANKAVASTPESGRVASFAFGTEGAPAVTFDRAGTFSFNITEDTAQDNQAGMSMDKHTARATVVVTDLDESGEHTGEHTGKLHVSSVSYANTGASDTDKDITDKAAFTNAYHASGTFGGVTVSKTLEGRASTAGQFTFAVTGLWYNGVQTSVDGAEANLSNKAAKAGVSGAVVGASGAEKLFARKLTEQDLGHTFAYRIHENQPATAAGYTYDTGYTGDAIVLVKVLARGDDPAKLYTVTTVLKGAGVTAVLGDAGDASALTDEKIAELKQDANTYVQQYDAGRAGTTTPAVSFVNRYTASLDYGTAGGLQIEKTLTYPKDATIFGSPKSTFRYTVKPADETSANKVGLSTDGKVFETANVEANVPKTVSLVPAGGLTFTQDDAGKTFTYTVSEIDDKATGYTYDKTVHTVRAVVADNGDGTLRVTTSVSKPGDGGDELEGQWIYPSDATSTGVATVKFKNTYTVTEAATYTPSVTKVVAGADAPGKFTFAMTAADDATKTAIDGKLITGSSMSAENGYAEEKQTTAALKDGEHEKIDFSKLTFNKPGTYKFAINEQVPNGLGEWTYDTHTYVLTITVTDEGGKLVARADGTTGSEGFIFTNSYQTSTSYELQGGLEIVKTLNGHDLHAGMFGFTVTGEGDASIEKLNKLLRADEGKLTVTNDEPQSDGTSHTGILGGLTFATEDAGKTFTYKIVENKGNKDGYKFDSAYWMVEIAVKKRDNGSLYTVSTVKHYDANNVEDTDNAKIYSSKDGTAKAQVSFTNSYSAVGTFDGLAAEKVMDSGDKIEADQYTFDLYAEKADGELVWMDEGKTQAGENGTAKVDFGKVIFKLGGALGGPHELTIDLAGAVKDGVATKQHNADHTTTYSFNLVAKERLANLPEGVRPVDTSATCRVLLEVTDNNNGKLTSKVTYRNGTENGKIVFHNTRDKVKTIGTVAKPDVDIDGQLLSVGDSYVYTINWVNTEADANGNLVPAKVTVTDELPTGVVFEAFEGKNADKGTASGQSLTWNLGEQPAGSHGSVRVRVKITEDAVKDAQSAVGTINNTATVWVDNKSYTGTTTNYVPKKSESDAQDSNESGVALGDELTYTIGYKNTEGASATVKITDAVPAGTEFVEFAGDHKDAGSKDNDGSLTWTLKDVPAGKEGTVQFKVRVTENAFKSGGASGDISNQASVAVGNNPAVKTNTTTDEVSDGRLTLSKTVTAAEGITAPNKAFTFKVLLYQADGTTPLAGTFAFAGRLSGTNGTYVSGQIKSGDTIELKAGGSVTVTLPMGAHYEVQELDSKGELMTSEDGFAVVDKANPQKGTVGQATKVGFTNVYSVESTKVENAFKVQKKISGRNWTTSDVFTMTLTAQGEAPMPKGAKDGVSTIKLHEDAQVGNFGTIEYTKPGTYTYVVAEQPGDETSLIFSKATYRATVTVTDDGAGKLSAKTKIAQLTDDAGDAVERTVEAAVFTNTAKTGSLTVKKTVVGGDSQREFGFTVALADGDGEPVSGTFGKGEHAVTFTDGKATFTLRDGGEKTIAGLPVDAHYTVTEDAAEGYTTAVNGADGSKAEGAVTEDGATVAFTNTYGTATEGRDVSTAGLFTKTLKGRDWAEGDSFQFALTGEDGAPMPEGSADGSKTVSVTAAAVTKAGDKVAFDFGSIRYTLNDIKDAGFAEVGGKRVRTKTFTYKVREVRPDDGSAIAGVDYDGHVATMTVTVADDGSGNLTATTPAIAQVSGGDFVNTYTTELDYSARAGVRLSKTLSGRAMEAGQFAFTVTADAETAAKLGLKTDKDAYAVAAADDGKADLVDLIGGAAESDVKFTDADAGKTYSFTVTETKLGGKGYTNDTAPRTVTIAPGYDAATGKLTVTTTVAKDGVEVARGEVSTADDATATPAPVTVAFQNSYEATGTLGGEGNVAINATKTLTGRAAAAGEFSFSVRDARGNVVATATNQASGDGEAAGLSFSPIAYTTDALEQMVADGTATRAADGSWVIPYTVSEDGTDRLPAGVTATASSFDITVKVTDNGKGGLDTAVVYPEGSDGTLSFVNGYGTNEATVDLAGTKTLALGQAGLGLAQADIAGKYTFKIEPLDGAPAPADASGKTVTEATNDAAGNVELGHVTFRQPSDLDDAEIDGQGLRTKTFAYRVSESGSVDGVVNDATAARTFTIRVVEDTAAGTLAAEVLPAEGTPEGKGAFEFTNTYGVNPTPSSVTDQIKVNKKLKGRDLAEGEFEFQLVEIAADGGESVAATGRNAADGTVALSPVTYTAPGTHSYELREVAGTAGGVTYDRATYRVRTTVTDAKNGTLAVKHELADAEGNPTGDDSVTFTNGYEAAPVTLKLGAAKVLKGAELKAGQFSFELKSRDGKVMSTARNAADGSVTFDALTFKQAGTYTFTVSEVDDGRAHVTYDKAVRKIVVTVSDEAADGTKTGYLSAKVSYEGDANLPPVFTNSYAENPGTPGTPENPGTPGGGSGGGSDNGSGSGSSGDGSKGGMPDTGDRSLPVEALGAMAGIGALAVAGGAALYRRRR